MVDRFKITYLGACPYSYSAMLFKNIKKILQDKPDPIEIALCHSDERKLRLLSQYLYNAIKRTNKKKLTNVLISTYTQEEEALANSDFVIQAISTNNVQTMLYDYYLPLKFGIVQADGSQVGPAGIFRSFRTNVLTSETSQKIHKICPNAPFMILTDPKASNILAAQQTTPSILSFGISSDLYEGTIPIQKIIQSHPDFEKNSEFEYMYQYAGIPYCSWLTKITYGNQDYTNSLHELVESSKLKKFKQYSFNLHLYNTLGAYSYTKPKNLANYFPDYLNYFNHLNSSPIWKFPLKEIKERNKIVSFLKNSVKKIIPHPILYSFRTYNNMPNALDIAVDFMHENSTKFPGIIQNHHFESSMIQSLPEESIVEYPIIFTSKKLQPASHMDLPNEITEILTPYSDSQQYTVEAALGNQMDLAVQAMLKDPLNQWIDDEEKITFLTQLMLYYEQKWLPEAWQEWIPTKEDLSKSKWWISLTDLTKRNKQYQKFKFPVKEEMRAHAFSMKKEPSAKVELEENV
ncbi:family 4 glycosyl hydrolase [Candidatus Lokiarchaeum ossiferum]|uniref:family 4 glycosyl hydrolase n=1 Tax=Candidatus Lokiarchaeum ossiferum TaxID=2951803 RepID=UPI00352E4C09